MARSPNAAANRCVNLFPEIVTEGGKEPAFLSRCPGLRLLATVGVGPIRGLRKFGEFGYVASGQQLFKISSTWNSAFVGTISGAGPVSLADNGIQLFAACNPDGFIYNAQTNVFQEITDPDFAGAVQVGYLDGYFVFNEPESQKFWVTSLLDGLAIDPLDFASAEGAPDLLHGLTIDHREAWLFGQNSIEVWINAGTADFPLQRIEGALIEIGCVSPYTVAKLDNSLFWLGDDARGPGIVYRANGYVGKRVSTHAVESAIQGYATITDALAFTYQQGGHSFYVLQFPSADRTWVYDVATDKWHERAGFNQGALTRHRSNCMMNFGGEIVVGDYDNANLYALDLNVYADATLPQPYLRAWRALPTGKNNLQPSSHHKLQLDCEAGVGLTTGQGSDPRIDLRWSDDGGHTWSNYHSRSLGKIGETGRRVIWHRLGQTQKLNDRIYEVSGTDPTRICITGAELSAEGRT